MKGLPDRAPCIDRVFVGRDANEADKAQRIRITPLPSIGHVHAERSIRRVLIAIPPDCPIAAADNGRFPALRWFLTRRPARSPRMARRS